MAVVLRLKRFGGNKKLFWRMVATDKRSPRDGRFIEEIGFYDPRKNPRVISIKKDRALYWLKVGAQPTETVKHLLKSQKIKVS